MGRVERREPDQPVDAALGGQVAVGVPSRDGDRRPLDAGLVAHQPVDHVSFEPAGLGPTQVHTEQHLGPILGVGTPGAGVNGQDGAATVVGAGEEETELQPPHFLLQCRRLGNQFVDQALISQCSELERVLYALLK